LRVPDPGASSAPAAESWRQRIVDLLEFRPRETLALGILCLAVVAGAAFAYARSLPRSVPRGAASPLASASPDANASGGSGGALIVHVAGAVATPGVYELAAGARVIDGLRAAGGATGEADLSTVNLARPLADGERVYIPRRGETPPQAAAGGSDSSGGSGGSSDGKVNLNSATADQLEGLPGIGEVLAKRIVDYRTQHGPYRSVRDLLKVEGIGEKKFESIKDHVTV
jgi:competence protein ComEA